LLIKVIISRQVSVPFRVVTIVINVHCQLSPYHCTLISVKMFTLAPHLAFFQFSLSYPSASVRFLSKELLVVARSLTGKG
jgi:hypothetical protein